MSETTPTSVDLLMQPWPLKCTQCKREWAKFPLIGQALGNAPSLCPECLGKLWKVVNDPPPDAGTTITFNGWKP